MGRAIRRALRLGLLPVCLGIGLGGTAPAAEAGWRGAPVLPRVDGKVGAEARSVFRQGTRHGERADVFAKIGDSISASPAFMQELGCWRWEPGAHRQLGSAVRFFSRRRLSGQSADCSRLDAFSRSSAATEAFAASPWALLPGASTDSSCQADESPLACELRIDRPAYAVILYGTNDVTIGVDVLHQDTLPGFLASMRRMIKATIERGVLPILNTIPPRPDDPAAEGETERFNAALDRLAESRHLPIINLWRAFDPLPGQGISTDHIHPSVFGGPSCLGYCDPNSCAPACSSASFTAAGLKYGHDQRNLLTLETLDRLRRANEQPRVGGHAGRRGP